MGVSIDMGRKVNAMMYRWREDGVSRKSFILIFAFAVLFLIVGFSRPSIDNIVEEVISGIIAIFFVGNIFGLLFTVLFDLYYVGALFLYAIYDLETYPTDFPLGFYHSYTNLLEGIDMCLPLTFFMALYLGISILRCRNMGVKWWWSLIPIYNPIVLFIKRGKK